jgi:hypothetical protein
MEAIIMGRVFVNGREEPEAGQSEETPFFRYRKDDKELLRLTFTKHGLAEDPRGLFVMFEYKNQTLLGEVKGVSRDAVTGAITLEVFHFNGEPWPVSPLACLVRIIPRNP